MASRHAQVAWVDKQLPTNCSNRLHDHGLFFQFSRLGVSTSKNLATFSIHFSYFFVFYHLTGPTANLLSWPCMLQLHVCWLSNFEQLSNRQGAIYWWSYHPVLATRIIIMHKAYVFSIEYNYDIEVSTRPKWCMKALRQQIASTHYVFTAQPSSLIFRHHIKSGPGSHFFVQDTKYTTPWWQCFLNNCFLSLCDENLFHPFFPHSPHSHPSLHLWVSSSFACLAQCQ